MAVILSLTVQGFKLGEKHQYGKTPIGRPKPGLKESKGPIKDLIVKKAVEDEHKLGAYTFNYNFNSATFNGENYSLDMVTFSDIGVGYHFGFKSIGQFLKLLP